MLESVIEYVTKRQLRGVKFSEMQPRISKGTVCIGLYVHVPFCKTPCPYCPYNRYPWQPDKAESYVKAVKKEIALYKEKLEDIAISSIYFGGGTPTLMAEGLVEIIKEVKGSFTVKGGICTEANPDDLNEKTLDLLIDSGVRKLSIGVQSFKDNILRAIGRMSHDGKTAVKGIKAALARDFDCINIDLMFSLPTQTLSDLRNDLNIAAEMEIPQITTYPLLLFPYTKTYRDVKEGRVKIPDGKVEKAMYHMIVDFLTDAGYEPCSVWSFTKQGVEKYGSVEREEYIGLGAGAASRIGSITYWNTFPVDEYIQAVDKGFPVAVGSELTPRALMMQWFMMRLYETGINKDGFIKQFGVEVDEALKWPLRIFRFFGTIQSDKNSVTVTKRGMYHVHTMTKTFLSTYINRICEECMRNPWPMSFQI
jgi:oxygen-independent coproporphyrinogen-3 oxidase